MNSRSQEQQGERGDEVLVDELFVEEYAPIAPDDRPMIEDERLKAQSDRVKGFVTRAPQPTLLGGLLALGGLALLTLLFARRRRRATGLSRLLLRLGLAR
jgi:hypothetical protein